MQNYGLFIFRQNASNTHFWVFHAKQWVCLTNNGEQEPSYNAKNV